jgi:transcription elongation factor Elf1
MDFRQGIGSLACRLCGASYQMPIHHLHEPVDVFSEWLDDCEAAAQGKPTGQAAAAQAAAAAQNDQPQYDISDDEDDDDDLGQPSGLSKGAASSSSAASGKSNGKKSGGEAAPTSYADLGLDDSDDDSD